MNLREIIEILNARPLTKNIDTQREINNVMASDLMSDVLNNSAPADLLLTGLANNLTIRTCDIAGIGAIIFVGGKYPGQGVIKLAEECQISVLCTRFSLYEACGRLYSSGLRPLNQKQDDPGDYSTGRI